jgi:PAS domain S-box-containing protein
VGQEGSENRWSGGGLAPVSLDQNLIDALGRAVARVAPVTEPVDIDIALDEEADRPGGSRLRATVVPLGDGQVGVVLRQPDARAAHLEAVAQLGQRALISDDLDALLADGAAVVASILGADFVRVLEHDPEAGLFTLRAAGNTEARLGLEIPDDDSLQPGFALAHRTPVVIEDTAADPRFVADRLLADPDVASTLSVVIRGPGWPFGVLTAGTRARRVFTAEEVDFVQSMANVLGTAAARHKIDAALRSERERLRLALDAGGMGDWEYDLTGGRVSWSPQVERIYGVEPGTFAGTIEAYQSLIHPEDRSGTAAVIDAAMADDGDSAFTVEHRVPLRHGGLRWVRGHGRVIKGEDGIPVAMIGVTADVTDEVEAEFKQLMLLEAEQEARAEAEAARDRLEFLAEASEVLASSLDYRATLGQVAHLAVPRLADWCTVDVVDDNGQSFSSVVVAHVDPDKVALAEDFRRRYPPDPASDRGAAAVLRSGEPQMVPEITEEMIEQADLAEEQLDIIRTLGLRSSLMVPLIARGRTLGVITMVAAESGRTYGEDDLALGMDLARRAAVAIDNSLLYRERSEVAEALQRSLLPPRRPEIPGLDVAVRYRPVGRGTEIGGDFYDVFETLPGVWAVVVGDVCGKGTAAAAVTGLVRDTLRGVTIHETSPSDVLAVLNEVVLRRDDDSRFVTVALALVEPEPPESGRTGARMRVACGGHPLPLLVRPDATVDDAGVPGMLLGLFSEFEATDVDGTLGPGEALVFYTDGVVEQQGPDGMFGEERLREVLAGCADAEAADRIAQAVVDAVAEWAPGPPQDDVAIVVLRAPVTAASAIAAST